MTPTPEMIAMAEDTANKKCLHFGNADWWSEGCSPNRHHGSEREGGETSSQ